MLNCTLFGTFQSKEMLRKVWLAIGDLNGLWREVK